MHDYFQRRLCGFCDRSGGVFDVSSFVDTLLVRLALLFATDDDFWGVSFGYFRRLPQLSFDFFLLNSFSDSIRANAIDVTGITG